jgi:tRNA ligase
MAVTVDDFELGDSPDGGQEGSEFVSKLSEEVRKALHITVGTSKAGVPPFEAKALVEEWHSGKRSGIGSLDLEGVIARGRVKGISN